ncbi:hypothetical protein CEE58_02745 [Stenotrophomonas maltophilia]|nr:hypothetical protein CEE58_02745 [Stenotrophomonas maltophilia]
MRLGCHRCVVEKREKSFTGCALCVTAIKLNSQRAEAGSSIQQRDQNHAPVQDAVELFGIVLNVLNVLNGFEDLWCQAAIGQKSLHFVTLGVVRLVLSAMLDQAHALLELSRAAKRATWELAVLVEAGAEKMLKAEPWQARVIANRKPREFTVGGTQCR